MVASNSRHLLAPVVRLTMMVNQKKSSSSSKRKIVNKKMKYNSKMRIARCQRCKAYFTTATVRESLLIMVQRK